MRLRAKLRRGRQSPKGKTVLAFGARAGYWPCLRAPFLELAFGPWRFEVWFGEESYR